MPSCRTPSRHATSRPSRQGIDASGCLTSPCSCGALAEGGAAHRNAETALSQTRMLVAHGGGVPPAPRQRCKKAFTEVCRQSGEARFAPRKFRFRTCRGTIQGADLEKASRYPSFRHPGQRRQAQQPSEPAQDRVSAATDAMKASAPDRSCPIGADGHGTVRALFLPAKISGRWRGLRLT
jgi:hypothetical protein